VDLPGPCQADDSAGAAWDCFCGLAAVAVTAGAGGDDDLAAAEPGAAGSVLPGCYFGSCSCTAAISCTTAAAKERLLCKKYAELYWEQALLKQQEAQKPAVVDAQRKANLQEAWSNLEASLFRPSHVCTAA